MVDYVSGGYLEELGPRIAKDKAIEWDQIAPFFRNFSATYDGKIYLDSARWRLPHALLSNGHVWTRRA